MFRNIMAEPLGIIMRGFVFERVEFLNKPPAGAASNGT
jgi:hypothetical protein